MLFWRGGLLDVQKPVLCGHLAEDSDKSRGKWGGGVGCPLRSLAYNAREPSACWWGVSRCVWRGHDLDAPAAVREGLHVPLCVGWNREVGGISMY